MKPSIIPIAGLCLAAIARAAGDSLLDRARDPSPAERMKAAVALKPLSYEESRDALAEAARLYDPAVPGYLEALAQGCTGKEEAMYAHLLGRLGAQPLKWTDAFADIASALHPLTAAPAFKDRAMAPALAQPRRKQAIDALAAIDDQTAAAALADIAARGPEDLRAYASGKAAAKNPG